MNFSVLEPTYIRACARLTPMAPRIHQLSDRFGKSRACRATPNPGHTCFVRMQNYVDPDVPPSAAGGERDRRKTAASAWEKIGLARDKLARAAAGDDVRLYPRFWNEAIPPREGRREASSVVGPAKDDGGPEFSFTVATFNTLARGLSSGPADLFPAPLAGEVPEGSSFETYGGFSSVRSPEVVLDFDVRKWRLLHVLLGGGLGGVDGCGDAAHQQRWSPQPAFDVLALEEVDEYNSFFRPLLLNADDAVDKDRSSERAHFIDSYHGVFQPKPRSPCVPLGWYSDGVALLWNTEKFRTMERPPDLENADADVVDWFEKGSFDWRGVQHGGDRDENNSGEVSNQVYVIVPLQVRESDKCLVVAAAHLKAKEGRPNERARQFQAAELSHRAVQVADQLVEQGRKDVGILIVGDFNSEPHESSVRCILSREEECTGRAKSWPFQSAYPLLETDPSRENSLYTTWKIRRDRVSRRIIDYIFFASRPTAGGGGLRCTHYLSVPKDVDVEEDRFPGYRYPSDHLLIAAKFVF